MKSKNLVRLTFAATSAAALSLFVAGCDTTTWVEGDAPEVPRGAFIEDKTPEAPAAMDLPETIEPETLPEGIASIPEEKPQVQQEAATDIKYVVQKNDTLGSIASVYGVDQQFIVFRNGLKQPYALQPGQIIFIPVSGISNKGVRAMDSVTGYEAPSRPLVPEGAKPVEVKKPVAGKDDVTHTVKAGEVLGIIARKYHVKQADILAVNNLADANKIRVGQKLIIPGGAKAAAAKPAAKPATAKKTPAKKPAAKKETAKADTTKVDVNVNVKVEPKTEPKVEVTEKPANEGTSLTDLTEEDNDIAPAVEAIPPVAAKEETSAPVAVPAAPVNRDDTLPMTMKAGTKLKDYAGSVGFPLETLQKLNPSLDPETAVTEDTTVYVPID